MHYATPILRHSARYCALGSASVEQAMPDGSRLIQSVEEIESTAKIVRLSRGRPAQYKPEFCTLAHNLALLGKSDEQIAKSLGVSYPTIIRWIEKQKAFRLALARARDIADAEVASSLFQRAKGYSHPAVKIFLPAGKTEPVIVPYTEHYAPDTAAALGWLGRKQAQWREKSDVNITLGLEHLVLASIHAAQPVQPPAERQLLDVTPRPADGYEDLL